MKFYSIDYAGKVEEISEAAAEKLLTANCDFIVWYDDDNNVFIGSCTNDKITIVTAIVKTIGEFKQEYYEAGDF